VLRAFYRLGFVLDHEGARPTVLRDPDNETRVAVIPRHCHVKQNLLRHILRGAGLSEEDFLSAYWPSQSGVGLTPYGRCPSEHPPPEPWQR
jgi:hypothetical protein